MRRNGESCQEESATGIGATRLHRMRYCDSWWREVSVMELGVMPKATGIGVRVADTGVAHRREGDASMGREKFCRDEGRNGQRVQRPKEAHGSEDERVGVEELRCHA